MKTFVVTLAIAAALGLSACARKDESATGTDETPAAAAQVDATSSESSASPVPDDFAAQCATFAVDSAAVEAITSAGATMDVFCGCLSLAVEGLPEAEQSGVRTAMNVVSSRISSDVSTDAIVDDILAAGASGTSSEADRALAAQVSNLGAAIGKTLETMQANGGACAG